MYLKYKHAKADEMIGSWFKVHGLWLRVQGHIRFMINDSRFMIIHYGREEKLL